MKLQRYQEMDLEIRKRFVEEKKKDPQKFEKRLNLSWSIWMFGIESLEQSLERVNSAGLDYVELKGDNYTRDMRSDPEKTLSLLNAASMKASGVIGIFAPSNDLSSSDPYVRQNAVDYVRNQVEFAHSVGGNYFIVVPSAVGRPNSIDSSEFYRSTSALRTCGADFERKGVKAAIEPIRSAEVSLIHSVEDVKRYINAVDHPAIAHINGDIYHMLTEEHHIGEAIIACASRLVNLHIADTNRNAVGKGMMDIDSVIMASYIVGMNEDGRFLTFEPLGPYPDPYVLANEPCRVEVMDELVHNSVNYFKEREEIVRELS